MKSHMIDWMKTCSLWKPKPKLIFENRPRSWSPNANFRDNSSKKKTECQACQRFALAACCHESQLTKRNQIFERVKALKRCVATRQPARDVGKLLTFADFAKQLENNLWQPTKLIATSQTEQSLGRRIKQKGLPNSTTFREKKADCEKFAGDYWMKITHVLRKPRTLPEEASNCAR